MNKKKTVVIAVGVLGVFAIGAYAGHTKAGARWGGGVFIDDNSRTFEGTMGGTHNTGNSDYIGCRIEAFEVGYVSASCEARDESGILRSCETSSAALVDAIKAIGPDDHVKVFYSGAQQCLQIRVSKYSSHVPKRPR